MDSFLIGQNIANGQKGKISGPVTPSRRIQGQLLQEIYTEAGVSPDDIVYLEAHGTGTVVGDRAELNSLEDIFGPGRSPDRPLLIGAVKTSIGHTEPASGIISVIKVLLSMHHGMIPANLGYKSPNPDSPALISGTFKMITEHMPFPPFTGGTSGLVGVSSFGVGGVNVHTILRSNPGKIIQNPPSSSSSSLPHLIPFSGRTQQAVEHGLKKVITMSAPQMDTNLVGVLHQIFRTNIPGHDHRGYVIVTMNPKSEEDSPAKIQTQTIQSQRPERPVYFIFSGMGSQWTGDGGGMGRDLLNLKIFKQALHQPAIDLKKLDPPIDLYKILEDGLPSNGQNNIIETMVCITAMQVGLVDLLKSIGVTPSGGLVGHSLGEIGCAYADNCLTSSQAILAAYARGKAIQQCQSLSSGRGAMASVGLTWDQAHQKCPAGIYPSCHNGLENVTVSGPLEKIQKFVEDLQTENIFAKIVDSMGIPFHSPYVAEAGPHLKKIMDTLIPSLEVRKGCRSKNWVTTSIPKGQWDLHPLMKEEVGSDYFVNNFLSPVLFHDALSSVQDNAIIIEIAPHALMQPILKRSMGSQCVHIPLMDKRVVSGTTFFLNAVGQMYANGLNPDISRLYENIQFPVPMETALIGPLIKWDHSASWEVPQFLKPKPQNSGQSFTVTLTSSFYKGHKIDGHYLFPAMGYVDMVRQTFAQQLQVSMDTLPVIMEDVQVIRPTVLKEGVETKFYVSISDDHNGHFKIVESDSIVGIGSIRTPTDPTKVHLEMLDLEEYNDKKNKLDKTILPLTSKDVYKILRLQGHQYSGHFQTILEVRGDDGQWGKIVHKGGNNLTCLLDGMAQLYFLTFKNIKGLIGLPTGIKKMVIDPKEILASSKTTTGDHHLEVTYTKELDVVQGPGIQIRGFDIRFAPQRHHRMEVKEGGQAVLMEKYFFSPFFDRENDPRLQTDEALQFCLDLALQDLIGVSNFKVLEILSATIEKEESKMADTIEKFFRGQIHKKCDLTSIQEEEDEKGTTLKIKNLLRSSQFDLILIHDEQVDFQNFSTIQSTEASIFLSGHSFILCHVTQISQTPPQNFVLVAHKICQKNGHWYLFKNRNLTQKTCSDMEPIWMEISHKNLNDWIPQLQSILKETAEMTKNPPTLYLTSQCGPEEDEESGILGFFNCLKMEAMGGGVKLRCYFNMDRDLIMDFKNTECDPTLLQLRENDLILNVHRDGRWGSYCHFDLKKEVTSSNFVNSLIHTTTIGDLASLKWIQSPIKNDHDLCQVHYASVNSIEVQLATGQIPQKKFSPSLAIKEGVLGSEFSGIQKNSRIMGCVATGALSTVVKPHDELTWTVPPDWTMAQASTVPLAYCLAYYGIILKGQLEAGSSILVHCGLSPVGQAAISIAQNLDCTIYTTVGSEEERQILKNIFQNIYIINLNHFEQSIYSLTEGQGVNLILNQLKSSQYFKSTIKCLADHGRFLEFGDPPNNFENFSTPLWPANVQFFSIDFGQILKEAGGTPQKISKLITQGLKCGIVRPIESVVFGPNEIEKAFRTALSTSAGGLGGQNFGKKILIKIFENDGEKIVEPRIHFSPQKSYIIIGGLGGFGLALASHLLDRGAKKLVLVSRSGITTGYQNRCVTEWRQNGIQVMTPTNHNVARDEGAENLLLETIEQFGPLGGIFNLGMVLKDGFFEGQTPQNFKEVMIPKIDVTKSLDKASRRLAPNLDFFVTFSSVSSGRGNLGQTNYAFANSYMERICESRQKQGLPALSIQWGPIGDVGIIQETLGDGHLDLKMGNCVPQRIWSCLKTLDTLLLNQWTNPVTSSMSICIDRPSSSTEGSGSTKDKISLTQRLAKILGMTDASSLTPQTSLPELGLDSLMAMELMRLLERDYNLILPPSELRKLTVAKIMEIDARSAAQNEEKPVVKNEEKIIPPSNSLQEKLIPQQTTVEMRSNANVQNILFLVHPIEGHVHNLDHLASHLEARVIGLQCTKEVPNGACQSMETLAEFYVQKIKAIQPTGPYDLAGYSFGCQVTVELALQLERENGVVRNLFFLDGSWLRTGFDLSKFNHNHHLLVAKVEKEKNEVLDALSTFLMQFDLSTIQLSEIREELSQYETAEVRLARTVDWLHTLHPQLSLSDIKFSLDGFMDRIQASQKYRPGYYVHARFILVKAKENEEAQNFEHDYSFEKISWEKVQIHEVAADHRSLIEGKGATDVAKIINEYLTPL